MKTLNQQEAYGVPGDHVYLTVPSASVGVGGVAISPSCGSFTTSSTSPVSVTNLSISVVTAGNPVRLYLAPDSSGSSGSIGVASAGNDATKITSVYIIRDGLTIATLTSSMADSSTNFKGNLLPPSCFCTVDLVPSGKHVYSIQVSTDSGVNTVSVSNTVLVAYEIS